MQQPDPLNDEPIPTPDGNPSRRDPGEPVPIEEPTEPASPENLMRNDNELRTAE